MSEKQEELITRLSAVITEVLGPELKAAPGVAILDFPNYSNVGDSAIYLGGIEFLRTRFHMTPRYVCDVDTFSPIELAKSLGDGVVLLQGGGNFGDIWPTHQQFRESVLRLLRGRRVVQLPQSIKFNEAANLRRAADAIDQHGDFLLLVRDRQSEEIARQNFSCEIRLCPDIAFALGPLKRTEPPIRDELMLLRNDKERIARKELDSACHTPVVDWLKEPNDLYRRLRWHSVLRSAQSAPHRILNRNHRRATLYEMLAQHRLARGISLLATARRVITDRLHGHILCVLLGIPHTALDNNYGKVRAFIETWTHDCDLLERGIDLRSTVQARE